MQRHISDFNSNQILQIINWASEKLNLPASVIERESTKIVTQEINGKTYLKEVNVNGKIINPLN